MIRHKLAVLACLALMTLGITRHMQGAGFGAALLAGISGLAALYFAERARS